MEGLQSPHYQLEKNKTKKQTFEQGEGICVLIDAEITILAKETGIPTQVLRS